MENPTDIPGYFAPVHRALIDPILLAGAVPMHLDAVLADDPLVGGLTPRLGAAHLKTLTIIGLPSATWPGLLDELNAQGFEYRWCTRAICLDKTDAARVFTRIRRQWFAKRKSVAAILKEVMTNEASTLLDSDAANKAADADEALQELGADVAGAAYVTATITVWDEDAAAAEAKLKAAEKIVQGRDFTCIPETLNALEAWLGSLPGHLYANVRQPPISTLNLAHMIPISAVWAGPDRDDHLDGPPLFHAETDSTTPFRFSTHARDNARPKSPTMITSRHSLRRRHHPRPKGRTAPSTRLRPGPRHAAAIRKRIRRKPASSPPMPRHGSNPASRAITTPCRFSHGAKARSTRSMQHPARSRISRSNPANV